MAILFRCISCEHENSSRIRPSFCEACGRQDTYISADTFESEDSNEVYDALDIETEEPEREETGDESLDSALLGGLVRPSAVTSFGRGGTGKSRSCLRWGTHMGTTLLISLEMPKELAVHSAKGARANLAQLKVTESENDFQGKAARCGAQILVFDSFNHSMKQKVIKDTKVPLILHELREWSKEVNGIVLMICHSNKKNQVSGTTITEHWPDYLFKFEKHGQSEAKITIPKSRYCPTGSVIVTI